MRRTANNSRTPRSSALAALVTVVVMMTALFAPAAGMPWSDASATPTIANIQYMGSPAVGTAADNIATITISDDASTPGCERTQTCFDPYRTTVTRGQTILWHNPTGDTHVIVSGSPGNIGGLFDTGVIPPGKVKSTGLDVLGKHQYFCVVHPWMAGVIQVADNPTWHHAPLKQFDMGVHPEHVVCKADRYLAYRTLDASPVCLTESGLEEFAGRGLAIPDDASITSDRIAADKEGFIGVLSDYIGHDDIVVTTSNIDDVEEHDFKIDYKEDVMWQIRDSIYRDDRSAPRPVPDAGWFDTLDDAMIAADSAAEESLVLGEILGLQSRHVGADAPEYSQTNIQVAGVDEPDFVKNDADSIYVVAQNDNIAMVDVDNDTGRMLAPGISPYIEGAEYMLLHQDVLAVLSDDGSFTTITLLDVSSGPVILAEIGLDSELRDARMIDGTIYVMTGSDIDEPPTLHDLRGKEHADAYEIHFFESGMSAEALYTITAIPLDDTAQARSGSFVIGESDTVYVSRDNIYVTHGQREYEVPKALFADGLFFRYVIGTMGPYELAQLYEAAADGDMEEMADFVLDSFDGEVVSGLVAELESYGITVADRLPQRTVIHKIAVDGTDIRYVATGVVDGSLLNSFALSEGGNGMLRVMTSTSVNGLQSNVYTLDGQMDVVGSLEGIAPGETLHSTRFSGDWLYAVTFRQVDPFFVIDVSGIEPKVLGVLKIPGYSEYLQNYDDTHVIGIGRDTNQNQFDTTEDAGIKISMFDVSDFENPREVQNVIVGDHSTDSAGLVEHKSLLIDDDKGILSIPIRFGGELFFYVYSVNDDYTMDVHSRIPHDYDESNPHHVRSLYIGDTLYTVTPKLIKANDLLQSDVNIGSLEI